MMKRYFLISAMCILPMLSAVGQIDPKNEILRFPIRCGAGEQAPVTKVWDGTSSIWIKGSGTENDPYLIEEPEHLAYLAFMVNNGLGTGADGHTVGIGKYWKLIINIDLNNIEWSPIGNWVSGADYYNFGGHFDGHGCTVSNLVVNSNNLERIGLFGSTEGGSISCLGVTGTLTRTGPLPASPPPHSDPYVGGIAGFAEGTPITDCYSVCTIDVTNSTPSFLGGIAGYSTADITNCYSTGNVIADFSLHGFTAHLGGIVGQTTATVTNCFNIGNLSISLHDCGNGCSCALTLGGISGHSTGHISCCYNTGDITCVRNGYNYYISLDLGGIAGYNTANITDCYNTGNINFDRGGGIVGNGFNIKNCYNTGTVAGGGIKGASTGGDVINSYYLNTCGGNNTFGGVTKTEVFMKTQEMVDLLGSSFKQDTMPYVNQGYPIIECTEPTYIITASANNPSWGTITPYGDNTIEKGGSIEFTITPNYGVIDKVVVNGVSHGVINTYTFENVQENGTIEAIFKEDVGIVETLLSGIEIYPNPTSGEVIIESGKLKIKSMEIFDVYGRNIGINTLVRPENSRSENVINISHLSAGVYFVKLYTELGEVMKKIVKE